MLVMTQEFGDLRKSLHMYMNCLFCFIVCMSHLFPVIGIKGACFRNCTGTHCTNGQHCQLYEIFYWQYV